ncbi:VOC family protein [Deinococcus roseus]|uniref:VOC domain-containing protein n=1 Tax=Deinococcus roseus TaxID=392414 RepID=A0ABQ2D3A7_9DEIO|nr:VOC family protein [Deinococcus roseus]GGJ42911.1 hypothetical protein GCM10008938_31380 [Deinococcus roseus]
MNPEQTHPAGVQAFAHVGITVSDLQHTIDFWQQVLGFTLQGTTEVGGPLAEDVTGVPGIRSKVAFLKKDSLTLEFIQPLQPEDRKTYRPTPVDVGFWHVALKVSNLDQMIQACGEWGWQIRGKVALVKEKPGPVGARLVYLQNQDGTILELVEFPGS